MRKAAARTVGAVCAAIGQLLDSFAPQECANYLKNDGYASTEVLHATIGASLDDEIYGSGLGIS